jgi:phosphopantetheine adenylyltransferase
MKTVITKNGNLACNITSDELEQIKEDLRPTTRRNDSLYEIFKQIAEEDKKVNPELYEDTTR